MLYKIIKTVIRYPILQSFLGLFQILGGKLVLHMLFGISGIVATQPEYGQYRLGDGLVRNLNSFQLGLLIRAA